MVRLKETRPSQRQQEMLFQFHYGTIKRKTNAANWQIAQNFNSTMVRLKVNIYIRIMSTKIDFNSTMVRLKDPTSGLLTRK